MNRFTDVFDATKSSGSFSSETTCSLAVLWIHSRVAFSFQTAKKDLITEHVLKIGKASLGTSAIEAVRADSGVGSLICPAEQRNRYLRIKEATLPSPSNFFAAFETLSNALSLHPYACINASIFLSASSPAAWTSALYDCEPATNINPVGKKRRMYLIVCLYS